MAFLAGLKSTLAGRREAVDAADQVHPTFSGMLA